MLTVRQPAAWSIFHAGKDVENRTRNIAGAYRGPVAVVAGLRELDEDHPFWDLGPYKGAVAAAFAQTRRRLDVRGAIVGVVDLVDAHPAQVVDASTYTDPKPVLQVTCCSSPWAEPAGIHLVLERPRFAVAGIPYRGSLGLPYDPKVFLETGGSWLGVGSGLAGRGTLLEPGVTRGGLS